MERNPSARNLIAGIMGRKLIFVTAVAIKRPNKTREPYLYKPSYNNGYCLS
jgi:hypothetical protein